MDLNPLSIWSVVLGIIWGFGVASLVAVVLGFMVLNRIDASEGRQKGRLLAAFGVLLGAAGVLITIVIGSMFAHDLSGI